MSVTDPDFNPVQRAERNAAFRALADKQVAAGPTPVVNASPTDQSLLWDAQTGAPFFAPAASLGRLKTVVLSSNEHLWPTDVDRFFYCVNNDPIEVTITTGSPLPEGATIKFYQAQDNGTISFYSDDVFVNGKWSTTGRGDVLTLTCVRINEGGGGGWIGY